MLTKLKIFVNWITEVSSDNKTWQKRYCLNNSSLHFTTLKGWYKKEQANIHSTCFYGAIYRYFFHFLSWRYQATLSCRFVPLHNTILFKCLTKMPQRDRDNVQLGIIWYEHRKEEKIFGHLETNSWRDPKAPLIISLWLYEIVKVHYLLLQRAVMVPSPPASAVTSSISELLPGTVRPPPV